MKKVLFVLFVFVLAAQVCLFADGGNYVPVEGASATKYITAYKNQNTGTLPDLSISLRLLDAADSEFTEDGKELNLPVDARGSYYKAFSWVLAGNAFGPINLTFSFARMTLNGANTSTQTEYVPYQVKMVYGTSKVGNSVIKMNAQSTAQAYVSNSFTGTTYRMFYADSISEGAVASLSDNGGEFPASNSVGNAFSVALTYNMSSNTKVENADKVDKKTEYINKVKQNDHANVCDYWNRTGTVYVKLLVNNDRTWRTNTSIKVKAGQYRANVIVGVTPQ